MISSQRTTLDSKRPSYGHPTTTNTPTGLMTLGIGCRRTDPNLPLPPSSSVSSIIGEIDIDRIEYVDPKNLLRLREEQLRSSSSLEEQEQKESEGVSREEDSRRRLLLDVQPVKRIHVVEDLARLIRSTGLNRLILVLINISNRISKFGLLEYDDQIDHLRNSFNPRIQSIVEILDELDRWITEIPLDKTPQRFGNKSFKLWGQRLESEAQRLHERIIDHDHQPIEAELLHHFKTSFGSFVRLDYGTGHELSFLGYLSILHLTRILKNEDLLMSGLVIFQRYINLCRSLQRVYNLEPAGSKGVYGLDDFFHIVYIFGSAQLLYHPTIEPSSILDEPFVLKITRLDEDDDEEEDDRADENEEGEGEGEEKTKSATTRRHPKLSSRSKQFMQQHGLSRSLFFQSIQSTIDLKSKTMTRTATAGGHQIPGVSVGQVRKTQDAQTSTTTTMSVSSNHHHHNNFLDHSPILWNLGSNVRSWAKIHTGLIKMFKGEMVNKLPVMQHFWMTDSTGVLSWIDISSSSSSSSPAAAELDQVVEGQAALDQDQYDDEDPDYRSNYANVLRKPVRLTPSSPPPPPNTCATTAATTLSSSPSS